MVMQGQMWDFKMETQIMHSQWEKASALVGKILIVKDPVREDTSHGHFLIKDF